MINYNIYSYYYTTNSESMQLSGTNRLIINSYNLALFSYYRIIIIEICTVSFICIFVTIPLYPTDHKMWT